MKYALFAYGKQPQGGINDLEFGFQTKKEFEESWKGYWINISLEEQEDLVIDIVNLNNFEFETFIQKENEWSNTKTFNEIEEHINSLFEGDN